MPILKSKKKQIMKKQKTKNLYEIYFNNTKSISDCVSAFSLREAKKKIKEHYPNDKITGYICLS